MPRLSRPYLYVSQAFLFCVLFCYQLLFEQIRVNDDYDSRERLSTGNCEEAVPGSGNLSVDTYDYKIIISL